MLSSDLNLSYDDSLWAAAIKYPGGCPVNGEGYGAPGEIRTPDLLLRRQPLYPAELRARTGIYSLHGQGSSINGNTAERSQKLRRTFFGWGA